jgi:predicted GIY-YIG superfamily endonuclease
MSAGPQRSPGAALLDDFIGGSRRPPFTGVIDGSEVLVFRVQPKTAVGASRRNMIAHAVGAAAGVLIGGEITYAARWACSSPTDRGGSLDTILLADPEQAERQCRYCFADPEMSGIGVYRFYDTSDQLIYIGSTNDLVTRIAFHRKHAPWRDRIADVKVTKYDTRYAALKAEYRAIREERPERNISGIAPAHA